MNTSFTRTPSTEWTATIRLGIWVSLVAVFAAVMLGDTMAGPVVIIGTIVGGSWLSWRQIDLGTRRPEPRRVPVLRR